MANVTRPTLIGGAPRRNMDGENAYPSDEELRVLIDSIWTDVSERRPPHAYTAHLWDQDLSYVHAQVARRLLSDRSSDVSDYHYFLLRRMLENTDAMEPTGTPQMKIMQRMTASLVVPLFVNDRWFQDRVSVIGFVLWS